MSESLTDFLPDFPRSRRQMRPVSIIPLVDVAMFLLIFFMVAGTIQKSDRMAVSPPLASSGRLMEEGNIMILLGAHGELMADEQSTDMVQLDQYLRAKLAANADSVITVKADAALPAVRMIDLMDRIKAAGGRNLSIVTQSSVLEHAQH